MPEKPGVTSQVMEDGSTEVLETGLPSDYDFNFDRVDGKLPEPPPLDSISKLYKPRYILEVRSADGTVIPFIYKRIDPATLMLTHGRPMIENLDLMTKADSIGDRLMALKGKSEEELATDEVRELIKEAQETLQDQRIKDMERSSEDLHKHVIQANVLSPEITDEIYENLEDSILEVLYQAITGGVTSHTELVDHFRPPLADPADA